MLSRFYRTLFLGVTVLAFVGCKTPEMLAKHLPWTDDKKIVESKFEKPQRLVVIWTAAIYSEAGKPPMRGFGGRIYFYNAENKAISVDGQLVVYGYDENRVSSETRTPDRRFAYTPEQFKKHFSETELGASYSVWIPWEAVGGPNMEISLLPIFTGTAGHVVVGQQSKNNLPGNDPHPQSQPMLQPSLSKLDPRSASGGNSVQPASYQAADAWPTMTPREGVRVETISLTPQTAQRLANSEPTAVGISPPVQLQPQLQLPPGTSLGIPATTTNPQQAIPQTTVAPGAIAPPWTPPDPRSTRYGRFQSQAPSSQSASPVLDRSHWPPGLSAPPSPHPSGPQWGTSAASPANSQTAGSAAP